MMVDVEQSAGASQECAFKKAFAVLGSMRSGWSWSWSLADKTRLCLSWSRAGRQLRAAQSGVGLGLAWGWLGVGWRGCRRQALQRAVAARERFQRARCLCGRKAQNATILYSTVLYCTVMLHTWLGRGRVTQPWLGKTGARGLSLLHFGHCDFSISPSLLPRTAPHRTAPHHTNRQGRIRTYGGYTVLYCTVRCVIQ